MVVRCVIIPGQVYVLPHTVERGGGERFLF